MLWADDILMLSKSEAGLQRKLNALEKYCTENKLSVNTKKTQCMIFNKTGRLLKNHGFTYNNTKLECVREYKYLGFIITPSGEVRTGLEDLRRRALNAFAKMKSTLGALFRHDVANSIHLYNYLVKPILTYCSDFWGCLQPKENPIEKAHRIFCKHLLGVRKQTNTEGVLQELGMLPLSLYAIKSVTKNWERIQQNKANTLLVASNDYSRRENLPWASNIRQIFASNGMLDEYLKKLSETEDRKFGPIANKLFKRLIDQFNQHSFEILNSSSKMKTLNLLKKEPGRETYLSEVSNSKHRSALSKLRLSAHKLEIEVGRYKTGQDKTAAESRFCPYCKYMGDEAVEDETHFLVICPMYKEIRRNLLCPQILQNDTLSNELKFVEIMTKFDVKSVAKFTYQAFNEREIKLDVLSTLKEVVSSTEINLKNEQNNPDPRIPGTYQVIKLSNGGLKFTLARI